MEAYGTANPTTAKAGEFGAFSCWQKTRRMRSCSACTLGCRGFECWSLSAELRTWGATRWSASEARCLRSATVGTNFAVYYSRVFPSLRQLLKCGQWSSGAKFLEYSRLCPTKLPKENGQKKPTNKLLQASILVWPFCWENILIIKVFTSYCYITPDYFVFHTEKIKILYNKLYLTAFITEEAEYFKYISHNFQSNFWNFI